MSVRELLGRLRLDLGPVRDSVLFRRLWLAQMVSFIGSEIGYVALSYQVYALTGSTLDVGLLSVAQLVPLLTLTLVGGAFADVFDRRRLMLLQQAGMIVGSTIALANAALPHPQVWPCFLAILVDSVAFSFGIGAQGALLPRLVADDQLAAANNLNSLISSLGAVAGPALAGVIIAGAGLTAAYGIDTGTFFATLVAVWLLPSLKPESAAEERPSLRAIAEGFRFIRSRPGDPRLHARGHERDGLRHADGTLPRARDASLPRPEPRRLSLRGHLGGRARPLALGGWATHVRRQGLVVVVAAALWGAAIAAFGFADRFWLALVLLAVAGGADLVSAVLRGTMLLELTPDSLRGRLNGIEFAQVAAAPSLGNLRAGALASVTSIRASVASGGIACVAGCALLALAFPALIRYDSRARAAAAA